MTNQVGVLRRRGPALLVLMLVLVVGIALVASLFGFVALTLGVVPAGVAIAALVGLPLILRFPLLAVGLVFVTAAVSLSPVGPLGIQPVHVITGLAIGSVALSLLRDPSLRPDVPSPLLWGAFLVGAALLATAFSPFPAAALQADLNLAMGVLFAAAVFTVARKHKDLLALLRCAVLGSLVVTMLSIPSVGRVEAEFGGQLVEGRLYGPLTEPNQLGTYATLAVFVGIALLLSGREWKDRALSVVGIAGALFLLTWSFSRGSWLGFAMGVLALVFLYPPVWRRLLALVLSLGIAVGTFAAVGPPVDELRVVAARVMSIAGSVDTPATQRPLIWDETIRLVEQSPVVGYGPGSFPRASTDPDSRIEFLAAEHAHNVTLEVLLECGLVGLLALLGLGIATARIGAAAALNSRRLGRSAEGGSFAALGAACVALLGQGLVDVTFGNPLIMVMDWAVLGLFLAAAGHVNARRQNTTAPAAAVVRPVRASH